MRRLLHWALGLVVAAAAGLVGLVWLAIDTMPAVQPAAAAQPPAPGRLRQLLQRHRLDRARPGTLHVLLLAPAEVQLLADQAAALLGGAARATAGAGTLELRASLPAPAALRAFGGWVNVALRLGNGDTLPSIESMRIGSVPVPPPLAELAASLAWRRLDPLDSALAPLHDMVQGVQLSPRWVQVIYRWRPEAAQQLATLVLPPAQQARLRTYQEALATLIDHRPGPRELTTLLTPLFALAAQRSAGAQADAAAENRAVLLTLAAYVTGRSLRTVLPQARPWPQVRRRPVLLQGRVDFAQHLLTSAALAAEGGGLLAQALGEAKEFDDARYGSGFSFNDIAADRAGLLLGEAAVRQPLELQTRLAAGVASHDLLPDLSDLPEFLTESEFRARFGGVGSPAYEAELERIADRLAALPVYR